MTKKFLISLVGIAAICFAASATGKITLKGSDTLVILAQKWAEKFMNANPDATIQVTGGGSGTGFAALINGTTDICNASRPIKQKEIAKVKEKFGVEPVEIKVAVDGIALYIHEGNKVKELSLEQIKGIYTGVIKDWKEVGGAPAKIIMYGRENSSGTYEFFREHVLENADYAQSILSLPGTAAIVNAVSKDKNGIGYGGAAYAKGIREIKVRKDAGSEAFEPNAQNIKSGSYPISRFLYMYTVKKPEGLVKDFTDWILSPDGQKIIEEVGYFPLK
jgi:phosphate transport system substrate-binding protein